MNKKQVKARKWLGIMLALAMVVGMLPTSVFADAHVHEYVDTVVAPTCTEGGYTLHKCSCGEEYRDELTDPVPHDYGEDGYCKYGCGYYKLSAPEGAKFTSITADAPGEIKIEKQEDFVLSGDSLPYYHLQVPEGTKGIKVTYPAGTVSVDEWGYAYTSVVTPGSQSAPANVSFRAVKNEDESITMTVGVTDYLAATPESAKKMLFRKSTSEEIYEAISFEELLPEGYYHVIKPKYDNYTISGEDKATDGYTFTVTPVEGYTPGPNFAIKVNGEVVATEPGEITLDTVSDNVEIAVEDFDVKVIVDLSSWDGTIRYNRLYRTTQVGYEGVDDNVSDFGLKSGEIAELGYMTDQYDQWGVNISLSEPTSTSKEIVGFSLNGKVYNEAQTVIYNEGSTQILKTTFSATSKKRYNFSLNFDTYDWDTYSRSSNYAEKVKGTWIIKPVYTPCEEHDWAPATCMEPETCTKCNMPKEGSTPDTENGHSWDEGKVTKEATIGAKGEILYRCEHNASHTMKEEIAQVDATELNSLISDAEAAPTGIAISEDGAGLEYGTEYVSQADKDALDAAVAAAKAVAANNDSTKDDVDDAYSTLSDAAAMFESSVHEFTALKDAENKLNALPEEIGTDDKEAVEAIRAILDKVDKEAVDENKYDLINARLEAAEAKVETAEAKADLEKAKEQAKIDQEAAVKEALEAAAETAKTDQDNAVKEALEKAAKAAEEDKAEAVKAALEDAAKAAEEAKNEAVSAAVKEAEQKVADAEAKVKAAEEKLAAAEKAKKEAEEKAAAAEQALKAAEAKAAEKVGKVGLKKAKGAKKKITVTWKKVTGAAGYEVIVAKNKKGTKNALIYTVKGNKAKKVIKKLKKGKYYVKVRAYKNADGNSVYGAWSKAKKAKVK